MRLMLAREVPSARLRHKSSCSCGGTCVACNSAEDAGELSDLAGLADDLSLATIVALQRSAGNAAVTRLLQRSFAAEGSPGRRPNLDVGDKGPAVSLLQRRLNKSGAHLHVDGDFGPRTHAAVVAYQTARTELLPATGGVGPGTWASLDAEQADRDACQYESGEKEASARSDGGVEQISDDEFLLTDFTPGKADLKPAHRTLLDRLAKQHGLDNPFTDDVLLLTGSTDCVSEESVADTKLRSARAASAAKGLAFTAAAGRVTVAQDPFARPTGGNDSREGRARNRNVRIKISKLAPEPPPKRPEPPELPGAHPVPEIQTFLVRQLGSTGLGGKLVATDHVHLQVVDLDQGLQADYDYSGAGFGASIDFGASHTKAGQFIEVKIDPAALAHPATLDDFEGPACLTSSGGGDQSSAILEVGRGFGNVGLDGFTIGPGITGTCGAIIMLGDPGRFDPSSVDFGIPGGA